MPKKDVDLKLVAENVGHSSRATCGACHFNGGGGDAIKHADMSRQLLEPDRNCDVHMGGYDFSCTECHKTRNTRSAVEARRSRFPRGMSPARIATRQHPTTVGVCSIIT
ncbi:MAG: hypothetical protein RBQ72_08330 [Desulfobacterium sp.]|jgi:hypothetical protein|nr:hypothetical protein [Desulfobacterium sp.]